MRAIRCDLVQEKASNRDIECQFVSWESIVEKCCDFSDATWWKTMTSGGLCWGDGFNLG